MKLFVFGLGYSASCIGEAVIAGGCEVCGTSRTGREGTFRFDTDRPLDHPDLALDCVTHLLISISPRETDGDLVLRHHREDLRQCSSLQWIGYLSTTGVYGDWGGGWVDEESETRPCNERLERRVQAEQDWLAFGKEQGAAVNIFRLAGIYGPGRSAIDQLREGRLKERIDKPGQVFSRIHVEDIAQVVCTAMKRKAENRIYNLCDNEPAAASDVTAYACKLLGLPIPPLVPFEQASLSTMAREFYTANRRVRNDRMKQELGIVLRYPSYREGLTAIAAGYGLIPA